MAETAIKKKKAPEQEFFVYRYAHQNDPKLTKFFGGVVPIYPPYVSIPHKDIINWEYKDEKGNSTWGQREIAYIEGVETIFTDEYEKLKIPKTVLDRGKSIPMTDGELKITKYQRTLKQYLDLTNFNGKNPNRNTAKLIFFNPLNEVEDATVEIEQLAKQEAALQLISSLRDEDIIPLAKFLDVSFVNPFTQAERDIVLIRKDLKKIALSKPQSILDARENPVVNTAFLVKTAIEKGVIKYDPEKRLATWGSTNKLIVKVPLDKDPESYITEYCFTEDGADLVIALKSAIK